MKRELESAIAAVFKELFNEDLAIELTRPEEQFGDFATNVALQAAGKLGKSPREIADQLAPAITERLADKIADVSVAGPGFINLSVTNDFLVALAEEASSNLLEGQTIITEYSDPNPFKPLHAGHLYTTLMGDAIARLLEQAGAKVVRINYGGDVGLHVGKSLWAIIQNLGGDHPEKLADIPEAERPTWLGERYVEGNEAYETDEAKKQQIVEINKAVYGLYESGDHDSPFAQIYWTCRQWSYDYFTQLYDQLKVHQFDRVLPESEVAQRGLEAVKAHIGSVYVENDDAVIFKGDDHGLHTRVFINSAGLPTYEAKEVGLLLTKWQDYQFDRSIIITANEQQQYMAVVVKSVEQFEPEPAKRSQHITHGVVKLKGGVKMSSRKGNIVGAVDILEAAAEANQKLLGQENADAVLGAVKYAFLKNRIGGDIVYDPEESVALEGNSGPYLQYAHARARSILRRVENTGEQIGSDLQPSERSLLRKISEYSETVDKAVAELMPHHICTYLYELAQEFNRFYEHDRVIGDGRQSIRLALAKRYADTLQQGLGLLGISAPEQM